MLQDIKDFKATEHQQNKCSSVGTKFECLRVSKWSSSIKKTSGYKPDDHQKVLWTRPMPENNKTNTAEESLSIHCIQDSKKTGRMSETISETVSECKTIENRLERSTRLLNELKNYRNRILIFSDDNTFSVEACKTCHRNADDPKILCITHGRRWGKAPSRRSARASDLD